jgi:hypothetical protein
MRGRALAASVLVVGCVTSATAHADEPLPELDGRIAADAAVGVGGGLTYRAGPYGQSETLSWGIVSAAIGLGWQLPDSRVALVVRAKVALGDNRDELQGLMLGFLGGSARLQLGANAAIHAGLGASFLAVDHGYFATEALGLSALLRAELFHGHVAFGLETTPTLFPELYYSAHTRLFDLMFTLSARR